MTTEANSLTGPTANQPNPLNSQNTPKKQSNRFMLSFGEKYAAIHDAIIADAENDERDPGEYVVRWLNEHYNDVQAKGE